MGALWQDIRYGLRQLWKNAGFTLVMVLVLSGGIGVSTGLFGSMEWRLHPPSPFSDPQRVVHLSVVGEAAERDELSYLDFLGLRGQLTSLSGLAAVRYESVILKKDQWSHEYEADEIPAQVQGHAADVRLMGWLSLIGMAMAGIGLYGIVAFSVTRSTHDMGVRMALGAQYQDVLRVMMGQGLKLSLIGLGTGLAGSFVSSRVLWASFFGTNRFDPIAFAGSSIVLPGAALLACYVPARRAARTNPMSALRYE
jgi:hypothetical protein